MRLEAMEKQVVKKSIRVDIEQLERNAHRKASRLWGEGWRNNFPAVLVESAKSEDPDERRTGQEFHNARHALWFLSMSVYGVVRNSATHVNPEKKDKILAHLTCLGEFLLPEQHRVKVIVKQLSDAILSEAPTHRMEWAHFLHRHWFLIRSFASYYGKSGDCFPMTEYSKVSDVLGKRQYFKLWWWSLKIEKLVKSIKHNIQILTTRGGVRK